MQGFFQRKRLERVCECESEKPLVRYCYYLLFVCTLAAVFQLYLDLDK